MATRRVLSFRVKLLHWLVVVGLLAGAVAAGAIAIRPNGEVAGGITVGEKLLAVAAERATLQARADGGARLRLLDGLRAASLLTDALVVRHDDGERPLESLPAPRQAAFAALDGLNATLREAMGRPGEGTRRAVAAGNGRALETLARLADAGDEQPVVLSVTPRFVPPRRATGELTLAPPLPPAPNGAGLRVETSPGAAGDQASPTVPRYAPAFAIAAGDDAAVRIEIVGLRLTSAGGPRPVLSIGGWRGAAEIAPERLFFTVPRSAFATDLLRTTLVNATLSIRRSGRALAFQLAFVVLPDRPGSFALDQKVRGSELETNTLVSPELLARAGAGETRMLRRCFDPPEGWRFDKSSRRIVIVERLGWIDDMADPTLNTGLVEFASDEGPVEICVVASAKPATKAARTATIGRFEVTLLRDRPVERVVRTGVRALDWREAARVPREEGVVEQRLYVRLFDEIDHEYTALPADSLPFLRIETDGNSVVLRADPSLEP
jgi:hypothetical protein